jgi:hypothetical protein
VNRQMVSLFPWGPQRPAGSGQDKFSCLTKVLSGLLLTAPH